MRTAFFIATLLLALPALAADPAMPTPPLGDKKIEAPPSPPPVTWEVWGYKWDNGGWVKQTDHCLKTTDLKQAIDYYQEIRRFQNWITRDNLPGACIPESTYITVPSWAPFPSEAPSIAFTVWAFQLKDGKWVKDEKYCWTTGSNYTCRLDALAYVKKVNVVPGWCATINAPDCGLPPPKEAYPINYHGPSCDSGYCGGQYAIGNGYVHTSDGRTVYDPEYSPGGRTIYGRHATIRIGRDANRNVHYDPPNND
jgi:hypothetical protein